MIVELNGNEIRTEAEFHKKLAPFFDMPAYGCNLNALWDLLRCIERPFVIKWHNSKISSDNMGGVFTEIIDIFERVKQQDISFNWKDKFDYELD